MPVKLEEAMGSIQETLDENVRLTAELEQLKRNVEILQEEKDEAAKLNEAFQPYADIILDPDAKNEWKTVAIRTPYVYKRLLTRTRQLMGNTSQMSINSVVQRVLEVGLSGTGWKKVVKMKYDYLKEKSA